MDSDNVLQAQERLGCQFVETLFYRAAIQRGHRADAEDKARHLNQIWKDHGFKSLPSWFRDFCKDVLNGLYDGQVKKAR